MPYSSYRADLMGTASLSPADPVEAGSLQSFELVYVAGAFGIDDTGSIKIGFRFATDFGPVQFDDPAGEGFTTAEASNGAALDLRWEFKRNIRPWSRSLYIGVNRAFLQPGDLIRVCFGDRRQGSPGIRVQTYCEAAFEFRVFVDAFATYDYVALAESPKLAIVPGPADRWRMIVPTTMRVATPFRAAVVALDKWGNAAAFPRKTLVVSANRRVEGLPSSLALEQGAGAALIEGLTVAEPGLYVLALHDFDHHPVCHSNPLLGVPKDSELVHFWGDLHGQSEETLGTNSATAYFEYGRDRAFIDVIGHQANDFQITDGFWQTLNQLTQGFDEPGRFVAIPGYEWSGNTALGGDRNVFFRNEGSAIHRSSHAQLLSEEHGADEESAAYRAEDLFRALQRTDCVVMAHVGGRYADIARAHDARIETAVEVHSCWGTFEWILRDALEQHHRVGIVCNSDGHKGRPGAEFPGASFFGAPGGLTCFLAPRLDRAAIFEAMRRRHHYGTTGNRCYLDVRVELDPPGLLFLRDPRAFADAAAVETRSVVMGDIARVRSPTVELNVHAIGSAPIERLDIFDGFERIDTLRPYDAAALGRRIRILFEGAEQRGRSRATIWDGALKVEGNVIVRAEMLNSWKGQSGLRQQSETALAWSAVTTGNFVALDLFLAEQGAGQLSITTSPVQCRIDVADVGLEDVVFEGGGLERCVRLHRLPERLQERSLMASRRIRVADHGDTRLFARLTQEDGHRAWSSPIYLFRNDGAHSIAGQ